MNDYPPEPETLHGAAVRLKAALKAIFLPPALAIVIGVINGAAALIRALTRLIDKAAARQRHTED